MTISEKLRQLRKKKGWTQAQLSRFSGVSQQAISHIESGRNAPTGNTLKILAPVLGCTVDELLGEPRPVDHEIGLTESERDLLHIFRQLNADGKDLLMQQAEGFLAKASLREKRRTSSAG